MDVDPAAAHNAIVAAQDVVPGRVAQVGGQVVGQGHRLRSVSREVSVVDVEYLHVARVDEPSSVLDVLGGRDDGRPLRWGCGGSSAAGHGSSRLRWYRSWSPARGRSSSHLRR